MTSIISQQDLNSEVLLKLLPMSPGLASKKLEPGWQDVPSTSELELAQQGDLFRFWFSHSTVYIWKQQQVYRKRNEIQEGKGHFLLLSYALDQPAAWFQAHCHVHTDRPFQLSWNLAACSSSAGVWLSTSVKAQPRLIISRRSRKIFPKDTVVFWHLPWAG